MSNLDTDERIEKFLDGVEDLNQKFREDHEDFFSKSVVERRGIENGNEYLKNGVGPAVLLYIGARSKHGITPITPEQFQNIENNMNGWLELYARCHGEEIEASFSLREAAVLFIETHNIFDVAQILTRIPER